MKHSENFNHILIHVNNMTEEERIEAGKHIPHEIKSTPFGDIVIIKHKKLTVPKKYRKGLQL